MADNWPSPRTIQKLAKEYRPRALDASERWRLTPDETDPGPIFDALWALVETTRGRLWYLSERQAAWIRVLHRARPDWPGTALLWVAQAYVNAEEQQPKTSEDLQVGLDHSLANSPMHWQPDAFFLADDFYGEPPGAREDERRYELYRYAARIQRQVWHGVKDETWLENLERIMGRPLRDEENPK